MRRWPQPLPVLTCSALAAVLAAAGLVYGQEAAQPPADPATTDNPPQSVAQTDALVNQELDRPVRLDLDKRPLPDVLDAITEATGVPFRVSDQTYGLLPYGRQTPISVTVAATPLRQTLGAITQKLGLQYVLRDEEVEIRPLPALERAGRRATVQEMAMLDLLAGVRLDLVDDRPTASQLLEAVDLKLQELDSLARDAGQPEPGYVVENRLADDLRGRPVFVARNVTLLEAMEAIHQQTGGTWYPWGDTLVVVPKDAWVRQMLGRPVNLSYKSVEVQQVLRELEEVAGVPFRIEPGAIQRIPENFRRVRLFLDNATVQEALESLGGTTGLSYSTDGDGIYIWNSDPDADGPRRPTLGGRSNAVEPPVMLVDLGDGTSLLIYERDLPPSVREKLDARRQQAIEALQNSNEASAEPSTQPAAN